MNTKQTVAAFVIATASLIASKALAEVVSFGLPAYAELGEIRREVEGAFGQVDIARLDLTASINYLDLILSSINTSGTTTNISSNMADLATAVSAYNSMNAAANAQSLSELAPALSPLNFSNTRASLNNFSSSLSDVNGQTSNPILPPTLQLYYAVAVSGRARQEAVELRQDAIKGVENLGTNGITLLDSADTLDSFAARLSEAHSKVILLQRKLAEALDTAPIASIVLAQMQTAALAIEGDYILLKSQVDDVRGKLRTAIERVSSRLNEAEQLVASIDYALTASPLPSDWTTASSGVVSGFFNISMQGRTFTHPYTEIDGPFDLGIMSIHNNISFLGDATINATIRFNVLRIVNDPILGLMPTEAEAGVNMSYVATLNIADDPGASADFFQVPALGFNVHILEEATARFLVKGRYDSPLQIVDIIPLDDNGFVTPTAPEPASLALWIGSGLAAVGWRLRSRGGRGCSTT